MPSGQKGLSKLVPLFIVVALVAGAGGLYLFSQKTGIAIPGMRAPLNAECKYKDPDLCKFLNNWSAMTNYSVVSSGKFSGETIESTFEIADKDTTHTLSKQNGKEISNSISIGDTTYTLDYTDHKWWKQVYKPEEVKPTGTQETKDQFTPKEAEDTSSFKFIVKEACGNLTCFKYEASDTADSSSKQFMWFDDRDYLIRKMVLTDSEGGSMEAVYTYGNVRISAPSPVKEGTPGAAGVSQEEVQKYMQKYQQEQPQNEQPTYVPADTSNDTSGDAPTEE